MPIPIYSDLLAIKMKKKKKNKPVYLGMSVLDISKTLIHDFWHDYKKNIMEKHNDGIWIVL